MPEYGGACSVLFKKLFHQNLVYCHAATTYCMLYVIVCSFKGNMQNFVLEPIFKVGCALKFVQDVCSPVVDSRVHYGYCGNIGKFSAYNIFLRKDPQVFGKKHFPVA